ncbi:MAG TPA: tRNA-guanine transglycosylase DpdA [Albitalea sp.]|uniref:tRNA-guanine transglycosylase DpdA n=1 Tax=Piscinibacter sp. TaxID=1903157 RepID=UPI002ED6530E
MKFLYSDTQDYVDPDYDFLNDRSAPKRERYWDDLYAHEIMLTAPYDGLLVAMSAVRKAEGVAASKVRYSTAEEQRLLRIGARKFLRFDGPLFRDLMLMGDCGAFAYVEHTEPAYSPEEVCEFYLDGEFTHGVSPDHVIFECDLDNPPARAMPEAHRRFQITLENARKFIKLVHQEGDFFEPMGAVQGWSPQSMAAAADELVKMGYQYLAIGGLVPLKVDAIKIVLDTIRRKIGPDPKLHLLGFAKADHIHQFTNFGITSFDSTSPLIRAFKDEKSNYYLKNPEGGLDYYTAIRIPQALENSRLMQGVKRGLFSAEDLVNREQRALKVLREFDRGKGSVEGTVDAVMDYHRFLLLGEGEDERTQAKTLAKTRERIERTLQDRPWKRCDCAICQSVGVEVIIFRSSNRNKRRGMHNLGVYHQHLKNTLERHA